MSECMRDCVHVCVHAFVCVCEHMHECVCMCSISVRECVCGVHVQVCIVTKAVVTYSKVTWGWPICKKILQGHFVG